MNGLPRRIFVRRLAGLGISATGLVLLDGCRVAFPFVAQPAKMPRVGYVSGDPADAPWVSGLCDELHGLGWEEGLNVTVDRRRGEQPGEISALVAELIALPVDVLVTVATAITLAAKQATATIPIVFISVGDPVGNGFLTSLAHPGGNITGVSGGTSTPTDGKRVELLKQVIPGLTRLAYISEFISPGSPAVARVQAAAAELGMQMQLQVAVTADELTNAFTSAARWPADAVLVAGVPGGGGRGGGRARIAELAAQTHLPTMHTMREAVDAGGLMSYGNSQATLNRHAAPYVDKILRGAKPADLPVEQLTSLEFVVNLKALQDLGLSIPSDVAAQVTEWVR